MERTSFVDQLSTKIRVSDGVCPNGHSLMSREVTFGGQAAIAVRFHQAGKQGMLYLNPFYGCFEYRSDVPIKAGMAIEPLCPHCGASLLIDIPCKICDIAMFAVLLTDGGQVEICPTPGCQNQAIKIVDLDTQLARMYVDETKVKM